MNEYNCNVTCHRHTTHHWLPQGLPSADAVEAWACRIFLPGTQIDITDAAGRCVRTVVVGRGTN